MSNEKSDILIATFPSDKDAQSAVEHVERVLAATDRNLQQGALISRSEDGQLAVRDLKDTSLRDIVASGTNLAIFLGAGTVKIALNATKAGAALFWHSGGRFLELTGAWRPILSRNWAPLPAPMTRRSPWGRNWRRAA